MKHKITWNDKIPYSERLNLPRRGGLYIIMMGDSPSYLGRASNLRDRFRRYTDPRGDHQKVTEQVPSLEDQKNVSIIFSNEIGDDEERKLFESLLIYCRKFRWNVHGKKYCSIEDIEVESSGLHVPEFVSGTFTRSSQFKKRTRRR